jgi:3-oxoacyl-[acyl-carrier-protein] synthase-3
MPIYLENISFHLPSNRITNEKLVLENNLRINPLVVERKLGIESRYWASEQEAASDLAISAIDKLNDFEPSSFKGAIWVSTISSDFLTPSTASIIKSKLGNTSDCPAIDLNAACSGQLFALECAINRLKLSENETQALVIATEVRSRYLDKSDRKTVFLFGDGATAMLLRKTSNKSEADASDHFEWIMTKTIPSSDLEIFVPFGGSVSPAVDENSRPTIKMQDGPQIFRLATELLTSSIQEALQQKNQNIEDFDFFIFHQGNGELIREVLRRLEISEIKTHINFNRYGNTAGASLGIALGEAIELKKIKRGDRVLLMAMGAGHHLALASLHWTGHE